MTADMYALRIAPASTVSFLENTAIILVPLVQAALLRRRPGRQELLPAGLALLGVACLTLRGGVSGVGRGELLAMTAALFYTAVILLTGVLSRKGDPLVIGVIQIGTIALLATGESLLSCSRRPACPRPAGSGAAFWRWPWCAAASALPSSPWPSGACPPSGQLSSVPSGL